jgi:hypothetical protein
MKQRKFICVQSSAEPLDRLNYNEQSKYIDDVTYLKDQQIDYNGWVITFSGTVEDGEIDISELTFSPAFAEQANQIIYL